VVHGDDLFVSMPICDLAAGSVGEPLHQRSMFKGCVDDPGGGSGWWLFIGFLVWVWRSSVRLSPWRRVAPELFQMVWAGCLDQPSRCIARQIGCTNSVLMASELCTGLALGWYF
jgi:hypothetical protein